MGNIAHFSCASTALAVANHSSVDRRPVRPSHYHVWPQDGCMHVGSHFPPETYLHIRTNGVQCIGFHHVGLIFLQKLICVFLRAECNTLCSIVQVHGPTTTPGLLIAVWQSQVQPCQRYIPSGRSQTAAKKNSRIPILLAWLSLWPVKVPAVKLTVANGNGG